MQAPAPRTRPLALLGCLLLAVALRGARLLERPFIHADGPGYIEMARVLAPDRWPAAFTGYYPPGFPLTLRAVHAAGLGWEAAGRAVAFAAGVATVPLTGVLGTAVLGPEVGVGAAALAAVHPDLTRASAEVLAETLYGLLVVLWAILVMAPPVGRALPAAAALGALASLVRVEGLALVALTGLAAWDTPSRLTRGRRVALALGAAGLILVPLSAVVRAQTGVWAMSGKEMPLVARKYGLPASGIVGLVLGHPAAFLASYPGFLAHQIEYTVDASHILLLVPIVLGFAAPLLDPAARRARRLTLVTLALFTLGIAVINPGKRYVTPLVPLALPWAALGARRLGAIASGGSLGRAAGKIARHPAMVGALALLVLGLVGLKPPEREAEACYRSVCGWVTERFGPRPPPIMAADGRIAYLCGAAFVLEPPHASVETAVAKARARGAGLWVSRAVRGPSAGLVPATERCGGRIVVFEMDGK